MSRGPFVKIYRSLWDGTLGQQPDAWAVFIFMLAHCDADGVIQMTPGAIAAGSGLTIKKVRRGIEILEQPDPESRTPDEEGRRIVRLDGRRSWGWRIVNYLPYRESTDAERKAAERHRKKVDVTTCHAKSCDVTPSHEADEDSETERREHIPSPAPSPPPRPTSPERPRAQVLSRHEHPDFPEFYGAYPRRVGRRAASDAFTQALARHMARCAEPCECWPTIRTRVKEHTAAIHPAPGQMARRGSFPGATPRLRGVRLTLRRSTAESAHVLG